MQVLMDDKRVVDFCGDDLYTGATIKKTVDKEEGTIKFRFKVKGGSGALMTTVIGDFVEHSNLKIFNDELLEHESKLNQEGYDAEDF